MQGSHHSPEVDLWAKAATDMAAIGRAVKHSSAIGTAAIRSINIQVYRRPI
jgi:hypothetical protein